MIRRILQSVRTIRGRLTLWYVATISLLFLIFLSIASFIFWNILNQQIEHHLFTVLEQVETVWQQSGTEGEAVIQSLVASQGMVVLIMAADGEIILQSTSDDIALPAQHQLQQHLVILQSDKATLPHYFSIENIRFIMAPTTVSMLGGVIGVGYQTSLLQNTLQQSILILGGLFIISIICVGFVGYVLADRALRPIRTITNTAQSITSSADLSDRIPAIETQGELGVLVEILNSMLTRLESSFNTQRQFLSDAAHTLKTPLTIVRTHVERLTTETDEKQKVIDTLDHLNDTVQDLLYISKLQAEVSVKKETVDVSQILEDVVEITRTLASEKEINVESHIQKGIRMPGDTSLLTRAFLNVAENAITYTQPKGTVHISLEQNAGQITVSFKDTGIGIPAKELDKITNRFYRASNSVEQGTGLGLAISKTVAESFGGRLEIASEEAKGTRVVFLYRGTH